MPIHVLLVEDSPVAREKVSGILAELDCQVTTANDGVEGLQVATQQAATLDLIVLDIQMPKADGITLLRYVRKLPELASIPIVMLTTQADKETVSKALGFGAKDFLRKDATIAHITERLSSHVEAARQAADNQPTGEGGESRDEKVLNLVLGSRPSGEDKGPYVLCHVPTVELEDFGEVRGDPQRIFYERLVEGIAQINGRFPRLQAGYRIESEAQEVIRLLRGEEPIPWLLLGTHPDGISLAKMIGLSHAEENRTIHVRCDKISSIDEGDVKSVTRMGAVLIEEDQFEGDGMVRLIGEHLVGSEQVLPNDVRLRELSRQCRYTPRNVRRFTIRYASVRKDGTHVVNNFEAEEPVELEVGDEALPECVWETFNVLGPGSRAAMEIPEGGQEDPIYYQVDVIDAA